MKLEDYKYRAEFSAVIKPLVSEEKDVYLAAAALKDIAKYIPGNLDPATNVDLLPFATNAFVANRVNKNDDVADGPTSVALARLMVHKPVNIEHNRSKVMGTILSYAFTKFGSDEALTEKQAIASNEPFNVVLGGVLWRVVNPEIANTIEDSSDPSSDNFESISASWEVGFMDYHLASVEGSSKNLKDAEIIKDETQVKKLSPHLKAFKGKGSVKEGNRLYRLITLGSLSLGIGLTEAPAAEVKGVATSLSKQPASKLSKAEETEEIIDKLAATDAVLSENVQQLAANVQEIQENSSQSNKNTVITNNDTLMAIKITKIEDLTDENLKQVAASEVSQWVKEQLNQANQSYLTEKNKLETQLQASKDSVAKHETTITQLQSDIAAANKSVNELKEKEEARAKQDAFNARMIALHNDFELGDAERQVITSDIVGLNDDDYKKYRNKLDVLLASKKKVAVTASVPAPVATPAPAPVAAPAPAPAPAAPVVAVASTKDEKTEAVETALANAKKDATQVPNTPVASESVVDKYAKAFGVDQWISDVKLTD